MTLDEVEGVLGPPSVRHDDWGPDTILLYTEFGLKIVLDERASRVECVEIVNGSAVVDDTRLAGSYSAVRDVLAKLGYAAQVEVVEGSQTGARYFRDLGIALWSEDPDGDRIDAASAWRRDAFQRAFGGGG